MYNIGSPAASIVSMHTLSVHDATAWGHSSILHVRHYPDRDTYCILLPVITSEGQRLCSLDNNTTITGGGVRNTLCAEARFLGAILEPAPSEGLHVGSPL